MATTKTIQPTGETINLPEMTDRPDMSVVSTSLGKVVDAVNSDNASLIKTEEALAIISTGNTHGAINAGQYVYVRAHSTLAEGLYLASANVAANGTLSGSNVTAVSGGGLNALNSNLTDVKNVTASENVTINSGKYLKIGRLVVFSFSITLSAAKDGNTGLFSGVPSPICDNIPFIASPTTNISTLKNTLSCRIASGNFFTNEQFPATSYTITGSYISLV